MYYLFTTINQYGKVIIICHLNLIGEDKKWRSWLHKLLKNLDIFDFIVPDFAELRGPTVGDIRKIRTVIPYNHQGLHQLF